jgi:hypothetical protein
MDLPALRFRILDTGASERYGPEFLKIAEFESQGSGSA